MTRTGSGRRVVSFLLLVLAVAVAAAVTAPAGAATRAASAPSGEPEPADAQARVLLVTLPRLTWERLDQAEVPAIDAFVGDAAVASMSVRTIGALTSPGDAYLSLGAGNRTTAIRTQPPGRVLMATESADAGSAAEVFSRRTGVDPSGRLLAIDFPEVVRRNNDLRYGAEPGSLGQALSDAGIGIGAVGNTDLTAIDALSREVGLSVVDDAGQAPFGEVGSGLLVSDSSAPLGLRMDPATVEASTQRAVSEGARVLVVEMSDLERAELARTESTEEQADVQYDRALAEADQQFAMLMETIDTSRDLVMLVGPTAPIDQEQLTVFAAQGPGIDTGWARSASTRRDGYVALTDVASTILGHLEVAVPDEMNDTPISAVGSGSSMSAQERIDSMVRTNDRAVFRDSAVGPITVAYIVLLVVMLALVSLAVARSWRRNGALVSLAMLVMAVPAATYLAGLLPYGPFEIATYGLAILAIAVVLAAICMLVGGERPQGPPVLLAGINVAVLVGDVVTGGNLQINTVFGYSPIVAGRFAGFGNQAFSLLAVFSLLLVTGAWEVWGRRGPRPARARLPVALALFLGVIVVVGAPVWGSDVGGVLASVPAFAVCILLLTGRRIRVRTVAVIAAATVGILALFAALDMSRPAESRTHLGRFAARVLDGEAGLILSRKLNANLSVLTSTVWALVIPAALLFFVYLTWRPNSLLTRINAARPHFRAFGVSAITLGLVAWALNDSGVAMPAMMLSVALPYTAILALDLRSQRGAATAAEVTTDGSLDGPEEGGTAESTTGELVR